MGAVRGLGKFALAIIHAIYPPEETKDFQAL